MDKLILTCRDMTAAVRRLEGYTLPLSRLRLWARVGLVVPSVRYAKKKIGGRQIPNLYSVDDLARVRLIVRLRAARFDMPRVKAAMFYLGPELFGVMKPETESELVIEGYLAWIISPGMPDAELPSGQFRLKLDSVFEGNEKVVRELQQAAA